MAPSLRLGLSGCHSQLGECACLSISSERIRLQDRFFLCIDCVKAAAYFIREIITFTVELLLKAFAEFLHKDHGSRLFLGRAEELTTGYQGTLLEPSHCKWIFPSLRVT
ncbi:hypothetical protein RvY_00986 [Ramazzottius varieornatus]|uniref:Uncharacterized protein n=1 Tax=Ramazzottius varieornatus TaxID=947166 RepID=A0A1D1ULW5_RAMVA|nr:hypothetical protein RvY_00986 [Ramazzottius varieornatus]